MESDYGVISHSPVEEKSPNFEKKVSDREAPLTASGSGRKCVGSKESGHSILNSVNKTTSQIKKPAHRRSGSPLNWFPRKKTDSYLMRKIKHLQEIEGMNSTLDETLGNANPHYTRIAREKIAAREAARKAMEARKAALVEASWCRILQAARIQCKKAEGELEKAKACAAEAFEAARAMGVMMYDRPDCPGQPCEVETFSSTGGRSTHAITASFETAFEVDKEVAAAVKKAFVRLAKFPSSSNKEEFKDLLWRISQNPDINETVEDLSVIASESEPDSGSRVDAELHVGDDAELKEGRTTSQQNYRNSLLISDCSSSRINSSTGLVDIMLDRLKGLHEDELASLTVIVATCGLNAALMEVEAGKDHELVPVQNLTLGSVGTSMRRYSNFTGFLEDHMRNKEALTEVPSLDKFLVKHVSRLEREVEEAKKLNKENQITKAMPVEEDARSQQLKSNAILQESAADLGSILVRHVSKLEREIQGAKNSHKNRPLSEDVKNLESYERKEMQTKVEAAEYPNVVSPSACVCVAGDKKSSASKEKEEGICEASHVKENKQLEDSEGLSKRKSQPDLPAGPKKGQVSSVHCNLDEKENIGINILKSSSDVNKMHQASKRISRVERAKMEAFKAFSSEDCNEAGTQMQYMSLDQILVKPIHRLKKEKMEFLERNYELQREQRKQGTDVITTESLDKILVKHVSRLEKEKQELGRLDDIITIKKTDWQPKEDIESLGDILVKHQSKIEKAKSAAAEQSTDDLKHVEARRGARERELLEAWGGLSLGNSIRPHISRIERDKAAWRRAEEEQMHAIGLKK
ncbi:uncharacterized protein [Typha latifolia]|uniref:uncharacterized protein n=1 Tax=Typha latifolia TaxID=4733 RepID=UPI003C302381